MDESNEIREMREAILAGSFEEAARLPLPASMRAACVRREDQDMFAGLPHAEKDPRHSVHVDEVPLPPLGPNEALVAVMASAINYNTVWTSLFEPLPTFKFL